MKEHPIPQDITGYRFHIVGSMTLKQFGEVLIGVIGAVLIYSTNLVVFIKYPLMFLSFAVGIVSAFLPIAERPLSHWLSTFFRILYKPTQFFWKREENIPELFMFEPKADVKIHVKELDLTPARKQRIKEFLSSSHESGAEESDFTPEEQQQMLGVLSLFDSQLPSFKTTHQAKNTKPSLQVRVRNIRLDPAKMTQAKGDDALSFSGERNEKQAKKTELFQLSPELPIVDGHQNQAKKSFVKTEAVADNLAIPESKAVKVEQSTKEEIEKATQPKEDEKENRAFVESKANSSKPIEAEKGQFNAALPFPEKPTEPNKLVGMVLTPKNELIPGAVVEIKTKDGQIVRAVKTNALGQFFVTTPLKKGNYVIDVEQEGFSFDPFSITLKNKIVDPIEVRSN